jgi:hypothetical protein
VRATTVTVFTGAFFALIAALFAVGYVSWRRTRGIRRGRQATGAPPDSISARTSRWTWLAGWAGVTASGWGAVVGVTRPAGLGLLAGGVFVALAGAWARVRSIVADPIGLQVRAANGAEFSLAWSELLALRPPRTPLAGWRFHGRSASRTLMPSDLWGIEAVLELAVKRAGLKFSGRRWSAGPSRT